MSADTDNSTEYSPLDAKSGADMAVRQFRVQADDDDIRLDRWFKRHLPEIGFAMVSRWARTGQIRIDGKRADPADHVMAGQTIRIPPGGRPEPKTGAPRRREMTEDELEAADAMVIHRDRACLVLNKPPGLATQGGTGTTVHVDGLLDAFMGEKDPRPRLVHRLDKDTSGALLIARTPGSAAFFSKRFSGRTARKVYWALVAGVPEIEDGLIELPLAKQPGSGGEKMHVDAENGQSARTRYKVLEQAGNRCAWVELQPLTGRTHQLRVHMAAIGHPIIGDGKYGGPEAFLTGTISRKMHLHARRLRIEHPDGTPLDVTAELPDHFANSMDSLGFDMLLGDTGIDDGPPPPNREVKKQQARAHAKQVRKSKRGERRGRGEGAPPKPGKPRTTKGAPAKAGPAKAGLAKGRPSAARPSAARPGAKPAPKRRPPSK